MEENIQGSQQPYFPTPFVQEIPHTPIRNIPQSDYAVPYPFPAAQTWMPSHPATPETPHDRTTYPFPSNVYYGWPGYQPPSGDDPKDSGRSTIHHQSNLAQPGDRLTNDKRSWRSVKDKVEGVLDLLRSYSWSIGDFLYYVFSMHDRKEKPFEPTPRHIQMVAKFLTGETDVGTSKVLELWLRSPYGLPPESNPERHMLYSTEVNYQEIKYARPAITSFAAQIVLAKLVKDATKTVKRDGGLHTFTSGSNETISRYDLGAQVFGEAMGIFQAKMPLAWHYLMTLAMPNEQASTRDRRPPRYVVTHALSALTYSRNMYAKLIPLEKGILNFACCANHYIYQYDSRVGIGPSYRSVYDALKKLAMHDAQIIQDVASSESSSWVLRFDNVQHYIRPRNFRVGREAVMKIGTAGTVFEFLDFSTIALDINDKKQRIAENKRKDLTFKKLEEYIDTGHIDKVCALQWLRVLVNYVPCLKKYKDEIRQQYQTEAAKKVLPPQKTRIFPLPTNGRNETITSELLKALLDFMDVMGYTEEAPVQRLLHAGGDGLTYERMVLLKLYMQFQSTPFQRLEWLQPFLETWHTSWTDLSRIYEAHWDGLLSSDPSSIGHSANQLKRKAPSNLKKVDYYPYSELVYQILDARILDCWRVYLGGKNGNLLEYFEAAGRNKKIPSFDDLHGMAGCLFNRYGHPHAFENALDGNYDDLAITVPDGDKWTAPAQDESSASLAGGQGKAEPKKGKGKGKATRTKQDDTEKEPRPPFLGDQTLAQSCRFLYDATVSREVIYATADGDVGRVWEILKTMIRTFAGSTHTKYMNYLLEMFCDLELESSPELRDAFLANWLVNPSGQSGRFVAGDKFQEQLQDEMYEHIGRKDRGFDEDYMRKVIAPNAYRFVLVKKAATEGLGLTQRTGKHTEPHTNPEMAKLLQVYQDHQLHLFRRGRTYGGDLRKTDDLGRGIQRLVDSKLALWVSDTTRARNIRETTMDSQLMEADIESAIDQLDQEVAQELSEGANETRTHGRIVQMADGELVFELDGEIEDEHAPEGLEEMGDIDIDMPMDAE